MTFMLGAFTQGLTQGAKDIYGLADMASTRHYRDAMTDKMKQETSMTADAANAAKSLVLNQPQQPPTPALDVTPSDSGTAGGGPGTTSNGPVAPTNFDTAVPQPNYMPTTQTAQGAGPQSAYGSPSGFAPGFNPEVGGAATHSAIPTPTAPTLASNSTRTQPTGLGGSYGQSFSQPAPQSAAVRPIVTVDPNQSNQAVSTNTASTAQPGQSVPPAAMPTYDIPAQGIPTTQTASQPGPNLGHVTNRPVGAALKDWWNGTKTPDQPMTHGKNTVTAKSADNIGRHLAGVITGQ